MNRGVVVCTRRWPGRSTQPYDFQPNCDMERPTNLTTETTTTNNPKSSPRLHIHCRRYIRYHAKGDSTRCISCGYESGSIKRKARPQGTLVDPQRYKQYRAIVVGRNLPATKLTLALISLSRLRTTIPTLGVRAVVMQQVGEYKSFRALWIRSTKGR